MERAVNVASISSDGHEEHCGYIGVLGDDSAIVGAEDKRRVEVRGHPALPATQNGCEMRAFIAAGAPKRIDEPK